MPIRAGDRPGLGGAAKAVADRARSIVRLELQLAATEVKRKVAALGVGIGLLVGAALFLALAFALAAVAAAIATVVSTWLALLIVTGGLFLLVGALAALGIGAIRKGTPPVPEQAIAEAKLTAEAVKNGKH
jgi:VIT1/CCC1 family predicted Fe2+/Mn2+ transporter